MEKTFEELQLEGQMNQMVENSLSSVEISHNSKGYTWKVKAYHEDLQKAKEAAFTAEKDISEKYGKITQ